MKEKLKEINYFYVMIILIILSIFNMADCYSFLSQITINSQDISAQDVFMYIIYGFSDISKKSLIDILRIAIPYLFVLLLTGIYLTDLLEGNKKYVYLVRFNDLKKWLKKNIFKLFLWIVIFFVIYYLVLIIINLIFIDNKSGFTEVFYMLNPFYNYSNCFTQLVIFQFLIGVTFAAVIFLLQLLLSLLLKDTHKSYIITSLIVLFISFCGKNEMYNPIMLSRHVLIDTRLTIHPLLTITLNIMFSIIIYFLSIKILKSLVRRDGI